MTNRKPYPILSALKQEGDTFTLGALKMWMYDYHGGPPQTAANDNDPEVRPVEWETSRYELSAEELIMAMAEDDNNEGNQKYVKQYSAGLHLETRKPKVRRTKKPPPPPESMDAEDETSRHMDAQRMRTWLGADAEILDMAIGPNTYRDVGAHIGATGSDDTLERHGKREVKAVAKTFYDEAA